MRGGLSGCADLAFKQGLWSQLREGPLFSCLVVQRVAACCIWVATKLEEEPRRVRDVLFVFHRMNQRREGLPLDPLEQFSKVGYWLEAPDLQ